MLQFRETRIARSNHMPIVSSVQIPEEGMALVYAKEDGVTKAQPSTGAAGEILAGVSLSRNVHPARLPLVVEDVVPVTLTVTLPRTPIAGQLLVKVAGTQVAVGAGAPADAAHVQLVGNQLTFFAGEAAKAYTAQMLYVPNVLEARAAVGDAPIGGLASAIEGVIGVLKDATFSTNFFDASVDWSTALYVKLAAGGTFTVGTANDHIPNVVVQNSPNSANGFLILSLNVA